MNLQLVGAVACALVAALWSRERLRERALGYLWVRLGNWAERWISLILPCLIIVLLVWPALGNKGLIRKVVTKSAALVPMANRSDTCGLRFTGHVVSEDDEDHPISVSGAILRIDQDEGKTDERGFFDFCLSAKPTPQSLVRVAHSSYVTRFLRYDDPIVGNRKDIDVTPKKRIVDVEIGEDAGAPPSESQSREIRTGLLAGMKSNDIELLTDDKLRDDIISKLHQYQEGRALYDPRTIQRAGRFHAASHGLFWGFRRQGGSLELEAKLVSFRSTKIEESSVVQLRNEEDLERGAVYLGEQLLARLAEASILSPRMGTVSSPTISAEGYALYIPRGWRLWISLVPEGIAQHFPQLELTLQDDGYWSAAEVHVGPEDRLGRPTKFAVYTFVADAEYGEKIGDYLRRNSNSGLDINDWSDVHRRILGHIEVIRNE